MGTKMKKKRRKEPITGEEKEGGRVKKELWGSERKRGYKSQ